MPATTLDSLTVPARSLMLESLDWSAQFWDPAIALLGLDSEELGGIVHSVRNSSWYALGLLVRNASGDAERAVRTLNAVLDYQFDEPGTSFHGTFYRAPQEAHPPANAVMWRDYDPNWRQFIGTTLALVLEEYEDRLPPDLVDRIDRAIELAIVGEPPQRCTPHYTNIALMKAALMTWAGARYRRPDWIEEGERFGRLTYEVFAQHDTFHEYNSPTYYGVNFYALALWRRYSHSQPLMEMGTKMEAALWRDVAAFYHAGLGNVAGPYSRTYGMDMGAYGALLGMSIWLAVGRENAPFPRASGMFEHGHDFCFGPPMGLAGTHVPEDVIPHLLAFQGERQIERHLPTNHERTASAWLGENLMIGAESLRLTGDFPGILPNLNSEQYHPVTLHWRDPYGDISWMRLRHAGPVEARAEEGRLIIVGPLLETGLERYGDAHRSYVFEVSFNPRIAAELDADHWDLPGLLMRMASNLPAPVGTREDSIVRLTYTLPAGQTEARFELGVARTINSRLD